MNQNMRTHKLIRGLRLLVTALLLAGLAMGLGPAPVAYAATLTVNSTDDVDDGACDATHCSLREAIKYAIAGDTIEFNLTYPATITLGGTELDINKNLTITGPGADQLTISGNNASRVFDISAGTVVNISGLTIADGTADHGGGIRNSADLTLTNSTVSGNMATGTYGNGGGIYNGASADLTLTNSTVSGNKANDGGGGIYQQGGCFTADTLVLLADGSYKRIAGVQVGDIILGYDFVANRPVANVVQRIFQFEADSYLQINGLEVTESHPFAVGPDEWVEAGQLQVGDDVVGDGFTEITHVARVHESTNVYNLNVAGSHNFYVSDGRDLFLVHNKMLPPTSSGTRLNNVTITDNTADDDNANGGNGGGVYFGGGIPTFDFRNTIIAGNDDESTATADDCDGSPSSQGYNLVGNGTGCPTGGTGDQTTTDPKLGPLSDNGGPTETHALQLDSLAVDKGSCKDMDNNDVTQDQRGIARPQPSGGSCDVGAYELEAGTIVIEKQTLPDGTTDTFGFTDDIESPFTFSLADDGTESFTDVISGTYTVTETNVASGFDLTDITCSDDNSSGNPTTGVASISLQPGETITCTFTNTHKTGTLEVVKDVIPNDATTNWEVAITGPTPFNDTLSGDDTTGARAVYTGTYTIVETAGGGTNLADYNTTYVCTIDGAPGAAGSGTTISIFVGEDEAVVCTFTNTRKTGTVEVVKDVVPDDATTNWEIAVTGPTPFNDTLSGDDTTGARGVYIGAYTIVETAGAGTNLADYNTTYACTIDGAPGAAGSGTTISISVGEGEAVACTFTNTRKTGTVEVVKDVVPDDATTNWEIAVTGPTSFNDTLSGDDTTGAQSVHTGAYTIVETAGAGTNLADYNTTYACTIDGAPGAAGSGTTISISVGEDEAVVCTFTNTRKTGTVEVVKDVVPDDATTNWEIAVTGPTPFNDTLSGDDTTGAQSVHTGAYTIVETAGAGTNLADYNTTYACTIDGAPGAAGSGTTISVSVGEDEAVVCTFTNTQQGTIIIKKQTDPVGATESFEFITDYGPNFTLVDNGTDDSGPLTPDSYSVSEVNIPANWTLDTITCVTNDTVNPPPLVAKPGVTIDLDPGEEVTCTFTNEVGAPTGKSTDSVGVGQDTYRIGEIVYATGSGFLADTDVDVYIVGDRAWTDGDPIPADVSSDGVNPAVPTDAVGNLAPANVWPPPLTPGEYDMVFDANQNGEYNAGVDVVDDPNHPGFVVQAPPPVAVGGIVMPVNRLDLLAPWMGLVTLAALAALMVALVRSRRSI